MKARYYVIPALVIGAATIASAIGYVNYRLGRFENDIADRIQGITEQVSRLDQIDVAQAFSGQISRLEAELSTGLGPVAV